MSTRKTIATVLGVTTICNSVIFPGSEDRATSQETFATRYDSNRPGSLENLDLASICIILPRLQTIKALICAFVVRIWHKTDFLIMWLKHVQ